MKLFVIAAAAAVAALPLAANAVGDLTREDVQEVVLTMGTNDDGDMYFEPNEFVRRLENCVRQRGSASGLSRSDRTGLPAGKAGVTC